MAFDVKVLDSAATVHLLSTNGVSTFDSYASDVFIIHKVVRSLKPLNKLMWCGILVYVTCSIKESTRENE